MPALSPLRPLLLVASAALPLVALAGCRGRAVTRDECDRLLDRYTEALVRADRPHLRASDLARLHDEARARARSHRAFQACTDEISREQMDCALAAHGVDAIERCLIPMP